MLYNISVRRKKVTKHWRVAHIVECSGLINQRVRVQLPSLQIKKNSNLITRYSNILKCTILGQKLGG